MCGQGVGGVALGVFGGGVVLEAWCWWRLAVVAQAEALRNRGRDVGISKDEVDTTVGCRGGRNRALPKMLRSERARRLWLLQGSCETARPVGMVCDRVAGVTASYVALHRIPVLDTAAEVPSPVHRRPEPG